MKMALNLKQKICYGIGNLGYGTISQTLNSFVMFFGTSVLGISGTLVGLAVAISVFWDGISDPIVGFLSDNSNNKKFGKRLGFLIFGTIGMVISNIFLWSVPAFWGDEIKFVWLLVCLLSLETFCTAFATPYVALGIDIAPGYNEQTKLQGFKTVFFILGLILPSILMGLFMPETSETHGQFVQMGYINISYVTSFLALVCGFVCVFGVKQNIKISKEANKKRKSFKDLLNSFFKIFYVFFLAIKKRNYGSIIIGYAVAMISTAFLSSIGIHLFTYAYHFSSTEISVLMASLFVGAIFSQPFWVWLSNRIDKKPSLKFSLILILFSILLTCFTFILRENIFSSTLFILVLFCLFFCGFGTGALYSLPISMYADIITIEKIKTGENNSGIYSGFMTFAYNIANCIALFVIGILLDIVKFNPQEPVQALSVQNSLGAIVFVGCAISIAIAFFIFSKYSIKRADVLKYKLKQRRTNKNFEK